jgi:DNA-binding XRE family transcriptional regulator
MAERSPERQSIRRAREALGLTQEQVADFVRISRPHYVEIEQGDREPSLPVALRIAIFLRSTVEELFGAAMYRDIAHGDGRRARRGRRQDAAESAAPGGAAGGM